MPENKENENMGGGRIEVDGREENPKIEVMVWRLGREEAAAEPRRCLRRIQRERTKKKAEGGGRVFRVRRRRESIFIDKEGGRACLVREK